MIGIDFGTSTTEVALYGAAGRPALVPAPDGHEVIPSVVAYPPNGKVLVGKAADVRRLIDPRNTLVSVKRIVGLPFFAKEVAEYRETHPYAFEQDPDGAPAYVTRAGRRTPEQVASDVFSWLRTWPALAEEAGPVVLTAPVTYEEVQRSAVLRAATAAGFEDVEIVDEPYAALLPYLRDDGRERTVVVYDLGGGTFDVAVMQLKGTLHTVLAAGGDPWLGGDDLDRALADWAAGEILRRFRWDVRTSDEARHQLHFMLSRAKVRLSLVPEARVDLSLVDPVLVGKELVVGRDQLEWAVHTLVQSTFALCDEVLREAGLPAQAVDEVVLAGGSTYMPAVHEAVGRYFGRTPRREVAPDRLVALGAGFHAALRAGVRPAELPASVRVG